MGPLNKPEGQSFIDTLIEQLGGIDFVILDNVQSLLLGDMKDEEPWQDTLLWARSLTNRAIGQLWVHHTGHKDSRSYGTKTREWQMDTMLFGERFERADTDVSIKLEFRKARERTPTTRADFADITVALANDVRYGLAGYLWTRDVGRAHRMAQALDAGMIWVNSENVRHLPTPFGGVKSSGIGRDGGDYSFDFYMETKNIAIALGDHKISKIGA